MTAPHWVLEITEESGPLYQRLAEKIESDIDQGILVQGDKLPAQRDLANDIGTTIGTVGRAYTLLRQKGLVSGEVGRGTYVLKNKCLENRLRPEDQEYEHSRHPTKIKSKIYFNRTGAPELGQNDLISEVFQETEGNLPKRFSLDPHENFPQSWQEAGSLWLSRNSFHASTDTIIPFIGTHAAHVTTIIGLTAPGDGIVFEQLTSAEIARSLALMGRRIILVKSDEHGIIPEDLEKICIQDNPKALFIMPAAHNPTAVTLPENRRLKIARIACDHDIILIEDDMYGYSAQQTSQPLMAELAPERTIVSGGLLKTVSRDLTPGWISCPPLWYRRIRSAQTLILGNIPFPSMELAARLVLSQKAMQIREQCTQEINTRLALVRDILQGFSMNICSGVPFVWLNLPDPWLSTSFKNAAQESDLIIDDSETFRAKRSENAFHGIRFSISYPKEIQEIKKGLMIMRGLLEESHTGYTQSD